MATELDLLHRSDKLHQLLCTVEVMLDREHQAKRAADLAPQTKQVYNGVVAEARMAGIFWPADWEILKHVFEHWDTQPALIRVLSEEIMRLLIECRLQPGALEELAGILKRTT